MTRNPLKILAKVFTWQASMAGTALLLAGVFAVVHLLGWRDDTSFITGTVAHRDQVVRGMIYALSYAGTVVLGPILLLAAAIRLLLDRFRVKATASGERKREA